MSKAYLADFSNFIGIGKHVSIDFRVKIRELASNRCVRTISVNTKLVEIDFVGVHAIDFEPRVSDALKTAFDSFVEIVRNEGYTSLYTMLVNLQEEFDVTFTFGTSAAHITQVMRLSYCLNMDMLRQEPFIWYTR